jgi:hypothetical protein
MYKHHSSQATFHLGRWTAQDGGKNGMELLGETLKQIDEAHLLITAPVAFCYNWDIYLASWGSG